MSTHRSRCSFPALISPSTGAPGTLVSVSGLNLSDLASDDTVFVLVNGLKVPFFLSPFFSPNTIASDVDLSAGLNLGLELLCSPAVVLQVPPFQPADVTVTVFEKVCEKLKVKEKCCCEKLKVKVKVEEKCCCEKVKVEVKEKCCCKKEKIKERFKELASFIFTITSAPTITNVSPGVVIPGTTVTLTGTGFMPGATVTIGGITVPTTFISSTEITFVVPSSLPPGTYTITVTNPNGTTVTSTTPNTVTVAGSSACALLMGTLRQFAVLGASTVTNTGATVITASSGGADVGVYPGTAITGFPPGLTTGTLHSAGALAQGAQAQATILYNTLAALAPTSPTLSGDLGGRTLTSGVYNYSSSAGLTGTLTLDGQGNPAAQFVFQIGNAFTTATSSVVQLINGAQACNVFWQVGSSATLGSGSTFAGQVVALTSITAVSGASINGRLFARNGAVTLDTNLIGNSACSTCP